MTIKKNITDKSETLKQLQKDFENFSNESCSFKFSEHWKPIKDDVKLEKIKTDLKKYINFDNSNTEIDWDKLHESLDRLNQSKEYNRIFLDIGMVGFTQWMRETFKEKFSSNNLNDQKESIEVSIKNYKKLGFEIEQLDNDTVKITQKRIINGYILNRKELIERAKKIFPNAKILPIRYSLDVADITPEWIHDKMKEFGLNTNDLVSQIALDKSSLSLFFSGERKMNKSVKALFFYYFLTYELNRDFREHLNQNDSSNKLEKYRFIIDENSSPYST
ncbi:hypothetical protein PQ459_10000 [Chryseobacterium sp. KACC 21268]|nr:hypothetical protein PQ459_10000 [Chryseobacterium sp. KACC 21268]